jgi:hypothetical protein
VSAHSFKSLALAWPHSPVAVALRSNGALGGIRTPSVATATPFDVAFQSNRAWRDSNPLRRYSNTFRCGLPVQSRLEGFEPPPSLHPGLSADQRWFADQDSAPMRWGVPPPLIARPEVWLLTPIYEIHAGGILPPAPPVGASNPGRQVILSDISTGGQHDRQIRVPACRTHPILAVKIDWGWCAWRDSNPRHVAPEATALSPELQARLTPTALNSRAAGNTPDTVPTRAGSTPARA